MSSSKVGVAFEPDNLLNYNQQVMNLVDPGVPMLICAGEFDSQDGPKTIDGWLRDTPFTTIGDFWTQNRPIYWVPNPDTSDPPVNFLNGGLYRTGGALTFLTLPKAGHFAPNNYYEPTY